MHSKCLHGRGLLPWSVFQAVVCLGSGRGGGSALTIRTMRHIRTSANYVLGVAIVLFGSYWLDRLIDGMARFCLHSHWGEVVFMLVLGIPMTGAAIALCVMIPAGFAHDRRYGLIGAAAFTAGAMLFYSGLQYGIEGYWLYALLKGLAILGVLEALRYHLVDVPRTEEKAARMKEAMEAIHAKALIDHWKGRLEEAKDRLSRSTAERKEESTAAAEPEH